jgi:hypothetical protein
MRSVAAWLGASVLITTACGSSFESGGATAAAGGASMSVAHAGGSSAGGASSSTSTSSSSHGGAGGQVTPAGGAGGVGGATAGGGSGGVGAGGAGTGGQIDTGAPDGAGCNQGSDCKSTHCSTDGVCCPTECSGPCQRCDGGKACTAVAQDTMTPGCNGQHACDASGLCKTASGGSCNIDGDCAAGVCSSDRFCCEQPCYGPCVSCAGGQCATDEAGKPGHGCDGPLEVCNAAGGCVKSLGAICSSENECFSGFCEPTGGGLHACCSDPCPAACTGCDSGVCSALPDGANDQRCAGKCVAGLCKLASNQACQHDVDCESGTCVLGGNHWGLCK